MKPVSNTLPLPQTRHSNFVTPSDGARSVVPSSRGVSLNNILADTDVSPRDNSVLPSVAQRLEAPADGSGLSHLQALTPEDRNTITPLANTHEAPIHLTLMSDNAFSDPLSFDDILPPQEDNLAELGASEELSGKALDDLRLSLSPDDMLLDQEGSMVQELDASVNVDHTQGDQWQGLSPANIVLLRREDNVQEPIGLNKDLGPMLFNPSELTDTTLPFNHHLSSIKSTKAPSSEDVISRKEYQHELRKAELFDDISFFKALLLEVSCLVSEKVPHALFHEQTPSLSTLTHLVASHDQLALLIVLKQFGAPLDTANMAGDTPFDLAKDKDTKDYLLKHREHLATASQTLDLAKDVTIESILGDTEPQPKRSRLNPANDGSDKQCTVQ